VSFKSHIYSHLKSEIENYLINSWYWFQNFNFLLN
jgi:hypothetical protein